MFDQIHQITGEVPLVQELIFGEELGAEFVCTDGEPVAEFAHRRIRSLTPMGGASVLGESVAKSYKRCCDIGRQLVEGLRWTGPVMVEFKIDNRDGRPKLIEINGRFWGSLPLAIASGIDFRGLIIALPLVSQSRSSVNTELD